jgi:hypothetical protein
VIEGATYDTGMLIALERRQARAMEVHERLRERMIRVTVPLAVLGVWWRGRTDVRDRILLSVDVELEETARRVALAAGEALAELRAAAGDRCRCRHLVDAMVMASAAARGDVVYTSDLEDLSRFSRRFPGVRLLSP